MSRFPPETRRLEAKANVANVAVWKHAEPERYREVTKPRAAALARALARALQLPRRMSARSWNLVTLFASALGTLFSGAMGVAQWRMDARAFIAELPGCFVGLGFVLFAALLALSIARANDKAQPAWVGELTMFLGTLGVGVGTYTTIEEASAWLDRGVGGFPLGVPGSAYSLLLFLVVMLSAAMERVSDPLPFGER